MIGLFETGTDSPSLSVSLSVHGEEDNLTGQHAFIDDAIAREKDAITRKQGQRRICQFVYVPRNKVR